MAPRDKPLPRTPGGWGRSQPEAPPRVAYTRTLASGPKLTVYEGADAAVYGESAPVMRPARDPPLLTISGNESVWVFEPLPRTPPVAPPQPLHGADLAQTVLPIPHLYPKPKQSRNPMAGSTKIPTPVKPGLAKPRSVKETSIRSTVVSYLSNICTQTHLMLIRATLEADSSRLLAARRQFRLRQSRLRTRKPTRLPLATETHWSIVSCWSAFKRSPPPPTPTRHDPMRSWRG